MTTYAVHEVVVTAPSWLNCKDWRGDRYEVNRARNGPSDRQVEVNITQLYVWGMRVQSTTNAYRGEAVTTGRQHELPRRGSSERSKFLPSASPPKPSAIDGGNSNGVGAASDPTESNKIWPFVKWNTEVADIQYLVTGPIISFSVAFRRGADRIRRICHVTQDDDRAGRYRFRRSDGGFGQG